MSVLGRVLRGLRPVDGGVFSVCALLAWALAAPGFAAVPAGSPSADVPSAAVSERECREDDDDEDCLRGGGAFTEPYQEYTQRMRSAQEVSPLASELMGDSVNLHDGQTTFTHVDIDVPGNGLPVQLRRRLSITRVGMGEQNFGGFSNWDIDVPYIAVTLPATTAWSRRCSSSFQPLPPSGFRLEEFWSGVSVHVPGGIDSELYYLPGSVSTLYPSDGQTYHWTTSDHSVLRCSGATASETFHMVTPEGTKYTFDTLTSRTVTTLRTHFTTTGGFTTQTRQRRYLLASTVEDRYGNRVVYSYNGNGYPDLIRSLPVGSGTPDREISLTYSGNRVTSATAHGRTWTYEYLPTGLNPLQYVTPPSDTDITMSPKPRWRYQYSGDRVIQPGTWDGNTNTCSDAPPDPGNYTVTIDHPSGASGTFAFEYHRLGRSGIPTAACESSGGAVPVYKLLIPHFADNFALQSKTLSGPGLTAMTWQYNYDFTGVGPVTLCSGTLDGPACTAQPSERWVQVTEPDQTKKRYRFGIKYRQNFGRLLGTETRDAANAVLASTSTTYFTGTASPFPDTYGTLNSTNDDVHRMIRPVTSRSETRQGVTFTASTPVGQFDGFGRPLQVTRASSLGYTRTETTTYVDKTNTTGGTANVWILGRIGTKTVSGFASAAEAYTYHAATLDRATETRFGQLQRTLGWHGDGMLHWVQDGLGQQTTLTNYYRGVPGRIAYADGTDQEAGINAFGQITWLRNEAGYTTSYSYTNDGRLSGISYPAGDTVAWTPTTVSFVPTTDSSLGVSGTHWRQTVTTGTPGAPGTGRKTIELDALWRPVTTLEEDTSNGLTRRYVARGFDHAGRETFASYPSAGLSTTGTWTTYDALGRPTLIQANSELGNLNTQIAYLSGFEKQVTNPRNFVTTTRYQVFDQPSEEAPYQIDDAFGTTTIHRNVLGAPTSMVRTGSYTYPGTSTPIGLSRTTSYVYDTAQRLCKTVEPESGATIIAYDGADNVQWRATGQTLTGTTTCNNTSPGTLPGVANLTYDARNRLKDTLYSGASTPNIFRTYTPDGLLNTVVSDGSTRTYTYTRRRLPLTETLTLTGLAAGSWMIEHGWHPHGHAASLTYPDGLKVEYAPNGLGQPTQAVGMPGSIAYATNASYHPTGEIAEFTYGNGVVYRMAPNARGLPQTVSHGTYVQDSYAWDPNGNVASITDTRTSVIQPRTRSMTYDARDRVETTTYAYNGRTFNYTYDVLDNLRTTRETPGGRNHRHEYAADGRLTRIVDPAAPSTAVIGYTYDARGNATSRTSATGFVPNTTPIVVDEANRVRSATVGADTETYTYDGLGRRTRVTTSVGPLMQFYSQAGQPLLWEIPGNEVKTREYNIHLGPQRIARRMTSSLTYLHTDHLGSPLAETTQAPVTLVSSNPHWEPYGAPAGGAFWGGLQFTGHYQDRVTRLTYMQQRYYDPYAGRFLAVDPVAASPGSFNRYWYAASNPYKYIDPDGRYVCNGSESECKTISSALSEINKSIGNFSEGSGERAFLQEVSDFYGNEGHDNGVDINIGPRQGDGPFVGGGASTKEGRTTISINLDAIGYSAGGKSNSDYSSFVGGVMTHEGRHGYDQKNNGGTPTNRSDVLRQEHRAYTAEGLFFQGVRIPHALWGGGSGVNAIMVQKKSRDSTDLWCGSIPPGEGC